MGREGRGGGREGEVGREVVSAQNNLVTRCLFQIGCLA